MKKIFTIFAIILLGSSVFAFCKPIDLKYNDGIYTIKLDGKTYAKRIKFVVNKNLITNKEAHSKGKSILTINTGFFDPKNQKTISYIVMDSSTVADPMVNENLLMNPTLRTHLDKILNRSEFRIVECNGKRNFEIVPHKSNVEFGCTIETSAQGGPQLLPELRLEEEFFILKDEDGNIIRESASVLEKTARTIIGLKDNDVYILIFTNKHPMTIYEARDYCKNIGLERAMAFDGGSSTSLNYKDKIEVTSTKDGGRMLKSFMIVK